MSAMTSQVTDVSIVYLTVCSGRDQRKHQCSVWLAFVRGIHRWPVNSPHKGPVTRKYFHMMTSPWVIVFFVRRSSKRTGLTWVLIIIKQAHLLFALALYSNHWCCFLLWMGDDWQLVLPPNTLSLSSFRTHCSWRQSHNQPVRHWSIYSRPLWRHWYVGYTSYLGNLHHSLDTSARWVTLNPRQWSLMTSQYMAHLSFSQIHVEQL